METKTNTTTTITQLFTRHQNHDTDTDTGNYVRTPPPSSSVAASSSSRVVVNRVLDLIQSDDLSLKYEGAQEIRRLTKTSQRCRRQLSSAIEPLVAMLRVDSVEVNEAALLALLNLAVKDEKNKIDIVGAGALEPIIGFLRSNILNLQEYSTAALLTLSASTTNKPTISASGAIPPLVEILTYGSSQAMVDSVMALYNLSTHSDNLKVILESKPIPPLVDIIKICKKSSKIAEKCMALIESLVGFDEGRVVLTSEEGGVLAVVEILENGSTQSRESAVSALLTMCESNRCKYREPILREGVIPGLLELTVQGTAESQSKARTLLKLLRESPYPRSELQPDTLENIVCNIISQFDGEDQSKKSKKMLAEMVKVSMEQSLRHLQQRALACAPSEVSSK